MNAAGLITAAEKKYINSLEYFFAENWGDTHLWSHDLDHHRRVWGFAKELLIITAKKNSLFSLADIETLLIACYLHDLGMCREPGEKHGFASSKCCAEFLLRNKMNEYDFPGLLRLIENHDDKNVKATKREISKASLLAAADDLDAFGYTGIYRYLEIYFLRGKGKEEVGLRIRENASQRFEYFEYNFQDYPLIVKKHKLRFKILDNFFSEYNSQIIKKKPSGPAINGADIIAGIVMRIIKEKLPHDKIFDIYKMFPDEPYVSNFIEGFYEESLYFSGLKTDYNTRNDKKQKKTKRSV